MGCKSGWKGSFKGGYKGSFNKNWSNKKSWDWKKKAFCIDDRDSDGGKWNDFAKACGRPVKRDFDNDDCGFGGWRKNKHDWKKKAWKKKDWKKKDWKKDDWKKKCGGPEQPEQPEVDPTCDGPNVAPEFNAPVENTITTQLQAEGSLIATLTAVDENACDTLEFSLADAGPGNSEDADLFRIDSATGELFLTQDLTAAGSADGDAIYEVTVYVTDGQATDTLDLEIYHYSGA